MRWLLVSTNTGLEESFFYLNFPALSKSNLEFYKAQIIW